MATSLPIVACSLSGTNQRERLDDWRALLAEATSRQELPNGMRFRFPSDLAERVRMLAAAEQECCGFLSFETTERGAEVEMTVETDKSGADALRFIFA